MANESMRTQFPLKPLDPYKGKSASIKRPREVAYFSYDDNHSYRPDASSLSCYAEPRIGTNLCDGFEGWQRYEEKEDLHLDGLLRALVDSEKERTKSKNGAEKADGSEEKEGEGGILDGVDFVTWRGMMTKIMTAPYDFFAQFDMFATLHNSTIYIEEDFPSRIADRALQAQNARPPRPGQHSQDMMTYWGYKFETISTKPLPSASSSVPKSFTSAQQQNASRNNLPVNNAAQFCSIVKTGFGPHSLLLGGEVDGVLPPTPSTPPTHDSNSYMELKTTEELPYQQNHNSILKFERKLLRFWAQSFLLGVPKVIVGYRSRQGILKHIQFFDTHKIPGMVRNGTGCWDGNVCINFATAFLSHLKETIKDEGVYKIQLRKNAGVVEIWKVDEAGTGSILSKEFLEWQRSKNEGESANKAGEAEVENEGADGSTSGKKEAVIDGETDEIL